MVEAKDVITICGIGATLVISLTTLLHNLRNDQRTSFVNTVTTSRLKWIDSLRDDVSEVIAVTNRLSDDKSRLNELMTVELSLKRDTLVHQIVLHLNPNDTEDQKIRTLIDHVRELSVQDSASQELSTGLLELRNATAEYLKKEWNRVKMESTKGQL